MERYHGVQSYQGSPLTHPAVSPPISPTHPFVPQGEKRVLFDAHKDGQKIAPKWVAPEDEQEPNESRRCAHSPSPPFPPSRRAWSWSRKLTILNCRLWTRLTRAIVAKEMDAATEAKTAVEDAQRETRRNLEERGDTHVPRFFHLKDGRWVPKLACVSLYFSSSFFHLGV